MRLVADNLLKIRCQTNPSARAVTMHAVESFSLEIRHLRRCLLHFASPRAQLRHKQPTFYMLMQAAIPKFSRFLSPRDLISFCAVV